MFRQRLLQVGDNKLKDIMLAHTECNEIIG